jgi:hypothetical protein
LLYWGTSTLKQTVLTPGKLGSLDAAGKYIYAFEGIGDTFRDFAIPLGDVMVGKTVADGKVRTQRHLTKRLTDWASGQSSLSDISSVVTPMGEVAGLQMSLVGMSRNPESVVGPDQLPLQASVLLHSTTTGFDLQIGEGDGAIALASHGSFGFFSDYDVETGGVNPILGFASGGAYVQAGFALSDSTKISFGFTEQTDNHTYVDEFTGEERSWAPTLSSYEASALAVNVTHQATNDLSLHVSYTHLNEASGLLGGQGSGALGLAGGATTDAITIGADAILPYAIQLSASATLARTNATAFGSSALSLKDTITSTAFEIAALKTGVFEEADQLRLSLTQPLHVESGALTYSSVQVVDRDSGEVGLVEETWELGEARQYITEAMYSKPLLEGQAEISLFARVSFQSTHAEGSSDDVTLGSRFSLRF